MPRADTDAFKVKNQALEKTPKYVVEMAFDTARTDLMHLTTDEETETPTTATDILPNTIKNIKLAGQSVNPLRAMSSISGAAVEFVDVDDGITDKIKAKLAAGDGLRHKTTAILMGFEGLLWADYTTLVTQINSDIAYPHSGVNLKTEDVKRLEKDQDLFILEQTNLFETIDESDTCVRVISTTDFDAVDHGTSYISDATSLEVGYIVLGAKEPKEIIRWADKVTVAIVVSGTDISFDSHGDIHKSGGDLSVFAVGQCVTVTGSGSNNTTFRILGGDGSPDTTFMNVTPAPVAETAGASVIITAHVQFYNCVRGVLGSQAAVHEVDSTVDADKKPLVEEYVYLEMPLPKLIKALITGDLHGQSGKTLPPGWHAGIDSVFFAEADYTSIGVDLWDTTDDTAGMVFRFTGLKRQNTKQFIAEQCLLPMFCFDYILNTGEISLNRMSNVLTDSVHVRVLDGSNVVDFGTPREEYKEVVNQIHIFWNWDDIHKKDYTRDHIFINSASLAAHQDAKPLILKFRGAFGNRQTVSWLQSIADGLFDRYSAPPIKRTTQCFGSQNDLQIGDVIRLIDPNTKDPSSTLGTTDRAYEIQSKSTDESTARVTFGLFGSAQKTAPNPPTVTTVLNDGFYSTGLLAANELDNDASTGLTTSVISNVLHITGGAELTGDADITANAAIYWYDTWPVVIDDGVIVTWTDNIQFRVKDGISADGTGTLSSIGGGLAGISAAETVGTQGGFGYTEAGGGTQGGGGVGNRVPGSVTGSIGKDFPYINLTHDGDSITGLPTDFRGCSGGSGHDTVTFQNIIAASGGAGGAGGGGILIITRSYTGSLSSSINTSGVAGVAGGIWDLSSIFREKWQAGGGGAGAPGGVMILLDGSAAIATNENVVASRPGVLMGGSPIVDYYALSDLTWSSDYRGATEADFSGSMYRLQYLHENITAAEDTPETTGIGTSISVAEAANTPPGQDKCTLTFTVNGSRDSNFSYDNIYYKVSTDTGYQLSGSADIGLPLAMDGALYDIKAHPVSIDGVESSDFVSTTYTVLNQAGDVNTGDIGSDVTDSYAKGTLSYKSNFDTITGWDETLSGATTSLLTNPTEYSLIANADAETARTSRLIHTVTTDANPTWANDRSVICVHRATGSDASHDWESYIGSGDYTATSRFIGFRIERTGATDVNIYARSGDGTTTEETLVSTIAYATFAANYYKYEVVFVSGTDVKFYIDDALEATHTTNIPSGTTDAERLFDHYLTVTTWNSVAIGSNLVEVNVVQAA